ncbi:MAG TPA: cysteine desulfurase family protein [Acidimicrobiales bacterium]|nr:cysteine desulfurase family protein [Acidimicrobiales bacterium]
MTGRHYLDHASTSPPRPEVVAAVRDWLAGPFGDPGRVHEEGRQVRGVVEEAREKVAGLLGVRPRQVVFTSGATEAANAAVWGATRRVPGGAVLCADVEHSSVRDASARLAPMEVLPVDGHGRIDPGGVAAALRRRATDGVALVHCQWANHEVGTVQPVAEVVAAARDAGVLVHVDAAAAAGQVDLGLGTLDADLVSVSGHKMGGPPGVGALVVRRGLRIEPLLVGGQQERARRGGMENVAGIVGFGAAADALAADGGRRMAAEAAAARARTDAVVRAATAVDGVHQVGDPVDRLPHLVCLGVDGVEAEPVLLGLDRAGVAAHSGSACSSESLEPSPVLAAMGVDPSHSLRLSVGWSTGDADVDAFAAAFGPVVAGLRALRR